MNELPKIPQLECQRCGHTWHPRYNRLPKVCPVCKRENWQEPKNKRFQ